MDPLDKELNDILVDTFRVILKVEEQALKNTGRIDLTINELHLLEAVGKRKEGRTISDIAEELNVTLPSVTIAINRLVKKKYVEKTKDGNDGRMVYVTLTKPGQKMDRFHKFFHEQMIHDIGLEITEEEKLVFLKGVRRINQFFRKKSIKLEAK